MAMALWTPYTDEPLDLSRPPIKQERASPVVSYYQGVPNYPVTLPSRQDLQNYPVILPSPPHSCTASPPQASPEAQLEALSDDEEYLAYERDALHAMAERNGGALLGNNPRMRRAVQTSETDEGYRRQRERNNRAAKDSRDRRKLREIRLAIRVTFLNKKMSELRSQLSRDFCFRCQRKCDSGCGERNYGVDLFNATIRHLRPPDSTSESNVSDLRGS